jgi:hypothetical protein
VSDQTNNRRAPKTPPKEVHEMNSSSRLPRTRRGLLTLFTALGAVAAAFFAVTALAATTVAFDGDGNSYNDPPKCLNKLVGTSGTQVVTIGQQSVTILVVDNGDKTSTFTVLTPNFVLTDVVVKASTDANLFSFSPGVTTETIFGPAKNGTTGADASGNSNVAADDRYGISHICFNGVQGVSSTAVTLRSFTATPAAKSVALNWRTASEASVLGYNLYGFVHGQRVKLNGKVIASKGSGAHTYSFSYRLLQGKQAPTRFWLQTISLDGGRQWSSAH